MVEIQSAASIGRKRKELVQAFSDVIHGRGAWLTSAPGSEHLRFEALPDSPLPQKLIDAGHAVRYIGDGERLVSNKVTNKVKNRRGDIILATIGGGPVVVHVFEIRLPVERKSS
jgi:hypothetical protein